MNKEGNIHDLLRVLINVFLRHLPDISSSMGHPGLFLFFFISFFPFFFFFYFYILLILLKWKWKKKKLFQAEHTQVRRSPLFLLPTNAFLWLFAMPLLFCKLTFFPCTCSFQNVRYLFPFLFFSFFLFFYFILFLFFIFYYLLFFHLLFLFWCFYFISWFSWFYFCENNINKNINKNKNKNKNKKIPFIV